MISFIYVNVQFNLKRHLVCFVREKGQMFFSLWADTVLGPSDALELFRKYCPSLYMCVFRKYEDDLCDINL